MTTMKHYGQSFVGRRKTNQDNYCIFKPGEETFFLAVADGMGGIQGGEIASALCIQTARDHLTERFQKPVGPEELDDILIELNRKCQEAIRQESSEKPELSGMGTTLSTVLIHQSCFACSNIGDSRIYLLKEGTIHQLSKDHTYIEEYAEQHGRIIPEQIIRQYSHFLTRCIDGGSYTPDIFPERDQQTLGRNAIFMLCSDGLILDKANTNSRLFANYLSGSENLEQAVKDLISHAYYEGSGDNITVVTFETGDYPRKKLRLKHFPYPPTDEINPYESKLIETEKTEQQKTIRKKNAANKGLRKWKLQHLIELMLAILLFIFALMMVLSHFGVIDLTKIKP
ncbi:MAG: serine/threonine-protein phosphatase [Bacteroidales bacterium]|nr:serine/threonine-protein phosphatase [Bacteroidales bacterium]